MSGLAAAKLESKYMKKHRRNTVVLFEEFDMDWNWDEWELDILAKMNNSGCSLEEMNEVFEREDPDEIFQALFYLAKKGEIKRIDLAQLEGKKDGSTL